MENLENKKQNFIVRLWKYFSLYEKIWLFSILTLGITFSIIFPEEQGWVRIFEIITLIGGCSCELLLSKQSKWCFVVSFFFYDLTQTVIYFADGYYVSALYEIIVLCPLLWVSFFLWKKHQDPKDGTLTAVKGINLKRDFAIFAGVLAISITTGIVFTYVGGIFEGISDFWYIDALANTFSICNALFMVFRYKEQWLPWFGVIACETVMWIISQNWVMLALQVGYLTNSIYGLIQWSKYVKNHPEERLKSQQKELSKNLSNKDNE